MLTDQEKRGVESTRWFIGLRPESRERCLRLLEEVPGPLRGFDKVTVVITPMGGMAGLEQGTQVSLSEMVPVEAGVEGLGWVLKRLFDALILAKAKAYQED